MKKILLQILFLSHTKVASNEGSFGNAFDADVANEFDDQSTKRQVPMTSTTRRVTASLGLVLAPALGFAAALRTPMAGADVLPAPPVSTPVTIPSLPSPPAVGGVTITMQ